MFAKKLINWYQEFGRRLPWRDTNNPYYIWLSEIILQQTRIEQGRSYYDHFVREYPTIADLAKASEEQVLKSWQGLGYYSRARNLHAAAQYVVDELGGRFPDTYEGILTIKGVGKYTAAAIASGESVERQHRSACHRWQCLSTHLTTIRHLHTYWDRTGLQGI